MKEWLISDKDFEIKNLVSKSTVLDLPTNLTLSKLKNYLTTTALRSIDFKLMQSFHYQNTFKSNY